MISYQRYLREQKESLATEQKTINEVTLGGVLLWSTIAILIGKLLGFKFKFNSNDEMTQWGVGLGDAFQYSRTKLKGSNIPSGDQARIERILFSAENEIKTKVKRQSDSIKRNPDLKITIDRDIESTLSNTVSQISSIVRDKNLANEYVQPLRSTFDDLLTSLDHARKEAVIGALATNPALKSKLLRTIKDSSRADEVMNAIASRVSRSVS